MRAEGSLTEQFRIPSTRDILVQGEGRRPPRSRFQHHRKFQGAKHRGSEARAVFQQPPPRLTLPIGRGAGAQSRRGRLWCETARVSPAPHTDHSVPWGRQWLLRARRENARGHMHHCAPTGVQTEPLPLPLACVPSQAWQPAEGPKEG